MATIGDEDFSAYVAARWRFLLRVAIYLGSPLHEAEDLVQTTLVRCYRSWPRIQTVERTDAYVVRVLVNTRSKALKRRWRHELPRDSIPDGVERDFTDDVGARTDLGRLLAGVSQAHREVLVLRYVADLTEQQTADALGVAVGTVKSRVARAMASIDPTQIEEGPRERR